MQSTKHYVICPIMSLLIYQEYHFINLNLNPFSQKYIFFNATCIITLLFLSLRRLMLYGVLRVYLGAYTGNLI